MTKDNNKNKSSAAHTRPFTFNLYDIIQIKGTEASGGPLWLLDVKYDQGYSGLVLRPLNAKYEPQTVTVAGLHGLGAEVVDNYNKTTVRVLFGGDQ